MWNLRSKSKKADKKLNAKIDDAIKAAQFAEHTAEQTVDTLVRNQYRQLGSVQDRGNKPFSEGKYLGPEGAANRGRFFAPFHDI